MQMGTEKGLIAVYKNGTGACQTWARRCADARVRYLNRQDKKKKKKKPDLPELRAAGLIVAGLMVAPSAPLGWWVEYIRASGRRCCTSGRAAKDRRGEYCACRATCLDIVGSKLLCPLFKNKKVGIRSNVNDAPCRNHEARRRDVVCVRARVCVRVACM